jgi:aminoglycoside phosphotransferase (APT) family kinase protein
MDITTVNLPAELELDSYELNGNGETNTVYWIRGRYQCKPLQAYVKVGKQPSHHLANEYALLRMLTSSGIPVPNVLWASEGRNVLLLQAIDGIMLWDLLDPRRAHYDGTNALTALRQYGEWLGRIHSLSLACSPQLRTRLYGLIGEEHVIDPRFQALIGWLQSQEIRQREHVFVHGDYNPANVLLRDGAVAGIIDWEYAGSGWKEYELAWALRARRTFLNTQPEREAFLAGYCQYNHFDPTALQWCEVLNYLHDAYWSRESNVVSTDFSLAQAFMLVE